MADSRRTEKNRNRSGAGRDRRGGRAGAGRPGDKEAGRPQPGRHSPEARVAQLLVDVVGGGQSLDQALQRAIRGCAPAHRGLIQAMSYEVLRQYEALAYWRDQLLDRDLPAKAADVAMLLLVGLERISGARRQASRAVNAAVHAVRELGQPWATGLVNAILRRATREIEAGTDPFAAAPVHVQARLPQWLFDRLAADWGAEQADRIGRMSMTHPPMTLRINEQVTSVGAYLERLAEAEIAATATPFSSRGITLLTATDVERLPGFHAGDVSVQDEAAQWVVDLVAPEAGMRVLDACSAPGGKTLALLQAMPAIWMTAVDIDAARLARVQENLERGDVQARLVVGDAAEPATWWDNESFDRILADVPCSATGVIRRHPDIKRLRRDADLAPLAVRQSAMLDALWGVLRPGGRMVYATCSILRMENADQIDGFLARHPDARSCPLDVAWGEPSGAGRQVFPQENGHDGFFYAVLEKRPPEAAG